MASGKEEVPAQSEQSEQSEQPAQPSIDPILAAKFDELSIAHQTLEHPEIRTMEAGREIMQRLEGVVPVNLLLKDKTGNRYLLIKTIENKTKFKDIGKAANAKALQMEARTALSEILNVPEGCATVFALLNDTEHAITVIIDDTIPKDSKINFHPLRNDATTTISYEDMIKFIQSLGNRIVYF